jgi:hypothetical protein
VAAAALLFDLQACHVVMWSCISVVVHACSSPSVLLLRLQPQRFTPCLLRVLHMLHAFCCCLATRRGIAHMDVSSDNVLLDKPFCSIAQVSIPLQRSRMLS